ncbi:YihY/virulence factor BrkB family protein [Leptospira kobayashii]|uniref:YihY/virulence factor BrkB family protein n=1 Tax=Leptospira kobayashii TaxID=1917830 RepID=UPI000D58D9F9|nr:YihY/virulence factor BrkB family protein [Leptospira kobayashii]
MKRIRFFFKHLYDYDIHGLASEISFTFLLTLFPLLVVFVSLLGIAQDPKTINMLTDQVGKVLPQPIFQPIDKSIENLTKVKSIKILTLSLVFSFFSSLAIFGAIGKALRFINDDDSKIGFFRNQWINLRLMLVAAGLLILYFYISYGLLHFEKYLFKNWKVFVFRKYPEIFLPVIAFLIIVSLFTFFYSYVSKKRTLFKDSLPGAILAASLWVPVTLGYQSYLQFKDATVNYSFAYDLLSKMVVLMIFAYMNATFFLWGAVWNRISNFDLVKKPKKKIKYED